MSDHKAVSIPPRHLHTIGEPEIPHADAGAVRCMGASRLDFDSFIAVAIEQNNDLLC